MTKKNTADNFWAKVAKAGPDECWPWLGLKDKDGYGRIIFQRKAYVASRLAYELTNGEIPLGKLVMHTCDHPDCVNPNHLILGTELDNSIDMMIKGRSVLAHMHPRDIQAIRKLVFRFRKRLAKRFGISEHHAYSIIRGARWGYVGKPGSKKGKTK